MLKAPSLSSRLSAMLLAFAAGAAGAQPVAPPRHNDMFGMWSPDGRQIAFTSDRTGDPEIFVADADGGRLRQLTDQPGRDAHPSWSPDGRALLFQSPRQGGQVRIFRMDRDGRNQEVVARTMGFCGVASWSPDGRRIAFQCSAVTEGFGEKDTPWRIFVMRPGDVEPRTVTHGPGNDQVPIWSPDGRRLLFFSDRTGANQVYELERTTGKVRQVTTGPASHWSASYAPDGKRIALMKAQPGEKGDIYVRSRPDRFVRITDSGPEFGTPIFSPDGRQLLLQMPTPDGMRLFVAPSDGSGAPRMILFRPQDRG